MNNLIDINNKPFNMNELFCCGTLPTNYFRHEIVGKTENRDILN